MPLEVKLETRSDITASMVNVGDVVELDEHMEAKPVILMRVKPRKLGAFLAEIAPENEDAELIPFIVLHPPEDLGNLTVLSPDREVIPVAKSVLTLSA